MCVKLGRWKPRLGSERGQALILFVGVFTVILVIAVIVVDVGLWLAERRSMQRAVDLAAAAAAQDLPFDPTAAANTGYAYATKNGFTTGGDVTVAVDLLCKNDLGDASGTVCFDQPAAGPTDCAAPDPCDAVQVTITKSAQLFFGSIFGVDSFSIGANAIAGVTSGAGGGVPAGGPQQTVIVFDAQASMAGPLVQAKDAAQQYMDTVLSSTGGAAAVGYAAFNYCYTPPLDASRGCIFDSSEPAPEVVELGTDVAALHGALARTEAERQGYPCLGLWRAKTMLESQPSAGPRSIVFLTNGDNRYHHIHFFDDILQYPPVACRPAPIDIQPSYVSFGCESPKPQEPAEDVLTYQLAQAIKATGVEIYIVGLNVCGADDGKDQNTPGYCAAIGGAEHDNIADQRLLKCIASSPDHYVDVPASGLMGAFQDIASEVLDRSLVQ